jgi:hypothetical protein
MSKSIIIIDCSEILEGKLDEVKAAMNGLIEFIKENEPRMIAYNVYLNKDSTQVTVVQVHPDSESAVFHMNIRSSAFSKFVELIHMVKIDIYGRPSYDLLDRMQRKAQMLGSETLVVHELYKGFNRFGV